VVRSLHSSVITLYPEDTFVEPLKTDEYLSRSVKLELEYTAFLRTGCAEMTKASPDYSEMRNLFKVR
jgi:hypothetical protein